MNEIRAGQPGENINLTPHVDAANATDVKIKNLLEDLKKSESENQKLRAEIETLKEKVLTCVKTNEDNIAMVRKEIEALKQAQLHPIPDYTCEIVVRGRE